jgi:6-phosphogluconolactonase/glucosamine-6-phosphate isomerase/deaminase
MSRRLAAWPGIYSLPDHKALSLAAAKAVADMLRFEPEAVFLLPTVGTPLGIYRRLVALHQQTRPRSPTPCDGRHGCCRDGTG